MNGATKKASEADRVERRSLSNDARSDRFELPDLCSPLAVFVVVLACQVVALFLTVARQPGWYAFYSELARMALPVLWIGLTSAALLCRLRPWLGRFVVLEGSVLTFGLVLVNVALVSEAIFWLGRSLGVTEDVSSTWFPSEHWPFLTRNVALAALLMAPLLRYFYVVTQWQRNVERQAESRLHALQARIRPHFLFNSMNTIAALVRANPPAAEQAVEDLADLFRASLSEARQRISLRDEIEVARVYERMEQLRLGDRLRVDWQVDALPLDVTIPSLTLQPLLENAVYHGIESLASPGVVTVVGETVDGLVRISVTNPVPPAHVRPRSGNRIALDNVRERLELAFGARGRMSVEPGPESFKVTVEFPLAAEGTVK